MKKLNKEDSANIRDRLIVGTLLMLIAYAACLAFIFIIEDMMTTGFVFSISGRNVTIALGIIYIIAITVLTLLGLFTYISCMIKIVKGNQLDKIE